jgi:hypothetical protein
MSSLEAKIISEMCPPNIADALLTDKTALDVHLQQRILSNVTAADIKVLVLLLRNVLEN